MEWHHTRFSGIDKGTAWLASSVFLSAWNLQLARNIVSYQLYNTQGSRAGVEAESEIQ